MAERHLAHDHEKSRNFKAGEVLFAAGDPGHTMFVVLEGQIELIINGTVVDRIHPGSLFGEMSMLDMVPRSATARAMSDGRVLEIDEREFETLIASAPFFAIKLIRSLVNRLRRANTFIEQPPPRTGAAS